MSSDAARPPRRAVLGALGAAVALPLVQGCSNRTATPVDTGAAGTQGAGHATASPSVVPTTTAASGPAVPPATSPPASPVAPSVLVPVGPDITHGPRTGHGVALTFHGAGDVALLRRMLAELRNGHAQVTVLGIGQWLAGDRSIARMILDDGHELGNHTWSHRTMPRLSASAATAEVLRAAQELRRQTGSVGRWFRPSGTPSSTPTIRDAARAGGYGACLGYDVDPMDYTDPGARIVLSRLGSGLHPGAIVSLHLGHAGTVQAMPQILSLVAARGLRATTISALVQGAV